MVRRRHFCDQHEALLQAQAAAVACRKNARRLGLTPERDGTMASALSPAGGALPRRVVMHDEALSDATRRHRPTLSDCPIPEASTLTMGGTCVEHDPPAAVTFPRGRPHVAVHVRVAGYRGDLGAGSVGSCS
jgi:hypothetical protein